YSKNTVIYRCPSAFGPKYASLPYVVDYVVNYHLIHADVKGGWPAPLALAAVDAPADYVAMSETARGMNNFAWGAGDYDWVRGHWKQYPLYRDGVTRHKGGMVLTMADGH